MSGLWVWRCRRAERPAVSAMWRVACSVRARWVRLVMRSAGRVIGWWAPVKVCCWWGRGGRWAGRGLEVGELGAPVVELFGVGVGVLPGGVVGVLQGEVGRSGGVPVVWAW